MKFWPQIIPHRDLEHLELLELLLWNSICNWNKYYYMLRFGIFTYYILLLGVKRSWVQVSSLGPKSADNRLIVCAFLFCLYLCTETWTPSPKANTIGILRSKFVGRAHKSRYSDQKVQIIVWLSVLFYFVLNLYIETWTPSPKANTIGQFAQQICGQSPQVSSLDFYFRLVTDFAVKIRCSLN